MLATKVHSELFGTYEQPRLVLLQRPEDPDSTETWTETELIGTDSAPDFAFLTQAFTNSSGGRRLSIIGGSFSRSELLYYEADLEVFPPVVEHTVVVDTTAGPIYSTQLADVTGDGVLELVVSNHCENGTEGAIFAYELPASPEDWLASATAGTWTRHTLASDFQVLNPGTVSPACPVILSFLSRNLSYS